MFETHAISGPTTRTLLFCVRLVTVALFGAVEGHAQLSPVLDASAQQTGGVTGRLVATETLLPVPSAKVRVVETRMEVVTDDAGRFVITGLKPGVYSLLASGLGFSRLHIVDVVIQPGQTLELPTQTMPIVRSNGEVQTLANVSVSAQRLRGIEREVAITSNATVTGSHLKRVGSGSSAVRSLPAKDVELRSALTPAMLFSTVPEVSGLPLNVSSVAGTAARGDNTAISLRGLGSGNTLMLLNGRRMVAHPIAPIDENSVPTLIVNVNQLPMHGLRQIEILKGGASSTYGFDAVAGVVDYRMDRGYLGQQVGLEFAIPEAGAGEEVVASWMYGTDFAGRRGHLMVAVDAYHREAIYLGDRAFSAEADHTDRAPPPFNAPGGTFDDGNSIGYYPSFRVGNAAATTYFRPVDVVGGVPVITTTGPTPGDDKGYYFNGNPFQTAFPETDRFNVYTSWEYDLTPTVTTFAEVAGYAAKSIVERQPIPYSGGNGVDRLVVLGVDNPYNPFGSRFYDPAGAPNTDGTPRLVGEPQTVELLSSLLSDAGPEHIEVSTGVIRLLAGLRGELVSGWSWETAALYSGARTRDESFNQVRESKLQDVARRGDATAYNPFGYTFRVQDGAVVADQPYQNPGDVMDDVLSRFLRIGRTSLAAWDFRVAGEMALGSLSVVDLAFGTEIRRETYADWRAPYAGLNPAGSGLDPEDNDFIQASPTADSSSHRNVQALYAEAAVPLVEQGEGVLLVHALELSFAGRYERYDDFGDEIAPRFGVNWRPVRPLRFHASFDRSYRAPNLAVLHAVPRYRVQTGVSDTYRRTVTGEGAGSVRLFYGGNNGLEPEAATGFNFGLVAEVPGVKGLVAKADYWTTRQSNVIGSDAGGEIALNDSRLLLAYVQQQLAAGVPVDQIDLGIGTAAYRGDPRVIRSQPTAEDVSLFSQYNATVEPAARRPAVGSIELVERPFVNNMRGRASGVDLGLEYYGPKTSVGSFDFDLNASYLLESYLEQGESDARDHRRGEEGSPRLRFAADVGWNAGPWDVTLSAYFISSFLDTSATTTKAVYDSLGQPDYIVATEDRGAVVYRYKIEEALSFDLAVGYEVPEDTPRRWLRGTRFLFKLGNLTDEEPPLASDSRGFSMSAHARLVAGRTWGLEVIRRF